MLKRIVKHLDSPDCHSLISLCDEDWQISFRSWLLPKILLLLAVFYTDSIQNTIQKMQRIEINQVEETSIEVKYLVEQLEKGKLSKTQHLKDIPPYSPANTYIMSEQQRLSVARQDEGK